MIEFGYYNMDCMDGMKEFPDKYFDLAIVDPPYGINVGQTSMGAGGALPHTKTGQRLICAPGGGNKQRIPFGGKRNAKFKSAEQLRSEANHSGGVSQSHPKSITRLMTARSQMLSISRNLNECRKTVSSGAAIISLNTLQERVA